MLKRFVSVFFSVIAVCAFDNYTEDYQMSKDSAHISDGWMVQEQRKKEEKDELYKEQALRKIKGDSTAGNPYLCGRKANPFRIAVLRKAPPFFWEDAAAVPSGQTREMGMMVELSKRVLDSIGNLTYKFVFYNTFSEVERALQKGEVDFAPAIYYNSDNSLNIEYVYPAFFANPIVAVFADPEQAKQVKSFTDLKGLKGVALKSESHTNTIVNFSTAERGIIIYEADLNAASIYDALLEKRYDYILTFLYTFKTYQKAFGFENKIYATEALRLQQSFFAFSKNTDCRNFKRYVDEYIKGDIYKELEFLFNRYSYLWVEKNRKPLDKRKESGQGEVSAGQASSGGVPKGKEESEPRNVHSADDPWDNITSGN